MAICDWCGVEFDESEAESTFFDECRLEYGNLTKCLCGNCAVQAIEDLVDGVYYETCDKCGKRFDLIEEEAEFENQVNGTSLRDFSSVLCCDCALVELG